MGLIARIKDLLHNESNVINIESLEEGGEVLPLDSLKNTNLFSHTISLKLENNEYTSLNIISTMEQEVVNEFNLRGCVRSSVVIKDADSYTLLYTLDEQLIYPDGTVCIAFGGGYTIISDTVTKIQ